MTTKKTVQRINRLAPGVAEEVAPGTIALAIGTEAGEYWMDEAWFIGDLMAAAAEQSRPKTIKEALQRIVELSDRLAGALNDDSEECSCCERTLYFNWDEYQAIQQIEGFANRARRFLGWLEKGKIVDRPL